MILPLLEGPAYIALRSGVPMVPVAVNGTSWLAFRRRVRVRIGRPIAAAGDGSRFPPSEAVKAMTAEAQAALLELVSDFPRSASIGLDWGSPDRTIQRLARRGSSTGSAAGRGGGGYTQVVDPRPASERLHPRFRRFVGARDEGLRL